MRSAYDEIMAAGIKRQHEPPKIVGDLLQSEIAEKQARSIKYQITPAKLPLAKDIDDFDFTGTPVNEGLLPVAVMHGLELSAHFLHGGRQNPVVERSAIPQGSRLAGQNRHIMPRIIDRLATAEVTFVLADLDAVLPDHDTIGIGV